MVKNYSSTLKNRCINTFMHFGHHISIYLYLPIKILLFMKRLDKRYEDSAPGKSIIIDWCAEFKRGRTNTDDAERFGRPKSAVVPKNITRVHNSILRASAHNEGYCVASDNDRRRSKPRRDQFCEHCRESRNFPNCVHWHAFYFM